MAGRYDRNPFEEDDVNPFAVSCLVNFLAGLRCPAQQLHPAPQFVLSSVPWPAEMWNLSGSLLELAVAGFFWL